MKTWLVVVLTAEAVLIVVLLVVLMCIMGTSSRFAEEATANARSGLRGMFSPAFITMYLLAALVLIPLQIVLLRPRKNRYD